MSKEQIEDFKEEYSLIKYIGTSFVWKQFKIRFLFSGSTASNSIIDETIKIGYCIGQMKW